MNLASMFIVMLLAGSLALQTRPTSKPKSGNENRAPVILFVFDSRDFVDLFFQRLGTIHEFTRKNTKLIISNIDLSGDPS